MWACEWCGRVNPAALCQCGGCGANQRRMPEVIYYGETGGGLVYPPGAILPTEQDFRDLAIRGGYKTAWRDPITGNIVLEA